MGRPTPDAFTRLGYPELWRTHHLYPAQLQQAQEAELAKEQPGPVCGSEHYRYGAFSFWLRDPLTPENVLHALVSAAALDPDVVMAQAALIDLVAHPNCNDLLYEQALAVFRAFPEQYFDDEQFVRAHRERVPSGNSSAL